MATADEQTLQQIAFHQAGTRKALVEAIEHHRAGCKLLRKLVKDHGAKNGISDNVVALTLTPKKDDD